VKARDLWEKIAYAAWASADPGLQYHSTINGWHTCPASGPIRASNPCSEYMFLDDTACNLASLNLLAFRGSSPSPAGGGSASEASRGGVSGATASAKITSLAGARAHGHVEGTAALKPERAPSPTEALENLPWSPAKAEARAEARALAAEKRAEAKAQGYEGEACGECGNFTLIRNGTCLKCNTCGGTTGCS